MKTLLSAYHAEFGWTLAAIIPYLRFMSSQYNRTVVVGDPRLKHLFEDFAEYEEHVFKGTPDMWFASRHPTKLVTMPTEYLEKYPDAKIIIPAKKHCLSKKKKFVKYGEKKPGMRFDLVIHARATEKYKQGPLNWPVLRYENLLKRLGDLSACSIGTSAHHIPGTMDLRNLDMYSLCNVLASSKVAVGTSSGPLHLAQFCCCPHVVITHNKIEKGIKATNRERYERIWAPFNTPCTVLDEDNWQPPVEKVVKAVEKFL